jgi:ribosome-binding protein aMBF1 (putative translation factor)
MLIHTRLLVNAIVDGPAGMDYYPSMVDNRGMHPIKVELARRWPPMSQAQLARRLDLNASVLSRYLNGIATPPESFYGAVGAVLGCDPSELKPSEPAAA